MVQSVHRRRHQLTGSGPAASLHHQHQRGAGSHRRQREDRDDRLLPSRRAVRRGGRERRAARLGDRARGSAQPDERSGRQGVADAGGGMADRHLLRRVPQAARVLQRRGGDRLSRARGDDRRRQPGLLPSLGSDQRRQSLLDGQLSDHRGGQGRDHRRRDRRPEQDPRSGRRRVPRAGRHVDHSRPRTALGHGRRRVVPQHGDDHPRPREGSEAQGHDAGAGESRAADDGFRRAIWVNYRPLDDRHVCRSGVFESFRRKK